ncbi:hypothetical protein K9M50_00400 [Patescibacteria group bacterium]|nr:hypothetical protein [Patescibacteria group bacterium]
MTKKKKTNKEVYSREDGNLSVLDNKNKQTNLETQSDNKNATQRNGLSLTKDGLNMGYGSNLLIGNLSINSNFKKRHEKHYKNSKFHLWADLIMAGIIIVLLIIILWLSFWQPHAQISLEAGSNHEIIKSADLQTFNLKYKINTSSRDNTIAVNLPDNFEFVSAVPSDKYKQDKNTFELGKMSSGSNGEVKIAGYVYGNIGKQQAISFNYNCSNCGKSGVLSSYLFNIEDSSLDVEVLAPDKIYKDIENKFNINIVNTSPKDIKNIYLKVSDIWLLSSNDNIENNRIIIDKINSGEEKNIEFKLISPSNIKNDTIKIETYLIKEGKDLLQNTWQKQIKILDPELKAELTYLNNIDNTISFNLDFKNNSDNVLSDISFRIDADDNIVLDNLSLNQLINNVEIIDNIFRFNKNLKSQESVHLSLKIDAKQIKDQINPEFELNINPSYLSNQKRFIYQVSSKPIKLLSNLKAEVKAYYYSPQGDQLGIGPLPPVEGLPTTYWIFFDASNFGNALSDFSLSGKLAKNVRWVNKKSVINGSIYQAPGSNKVTWQIRNINNKSLDNKARFALTLTPDISQVNTIPTLFYDITVNAVDNFTQKNINFKLQDINAELTHDPLASGQGKVEN